MHSSGWLSNIQTLSPENPEMFFLGDLYFSMQSQCKAIFKLCCENWCVLGFQYSS